MGPVVEPPVKAAALVYAETCVPCHKIAGDGGTVGPDLTRVSERRDADGIRAVIEDASAVYGDSDMPTFKGKLSDAQIAAMADYLSGKR